MEIKLNRLSNKDVEAIKAECRTQLDRLSDNREGLSELECARLRKRIHGVLIQLAKSEYRTSYFGAQRDRQIVPRQTTHRRIVKSTPVVSTPSSDAATSSTANSKAS